ncbi:MAG TPA: TnsA endonuclease N-terminal domain-containing protein [Candidatus Glassbacteria bacterium]|nr:TnsA endonuclease N-terminal domain-containing protein [Candidatus Glassbacteria bacterium]
MKKDDKKYKWYLYKVQNRDKYLAHKIPVCRSKWEYSFCEFLDTNKNILKWSIEPFAIPYFSSTTRTNRNYFPDFYVLDNNKKTYIVEVKPFRETKKPKVSKTKKKTTLIYEQKTYMTNLSKWEAAQIFCEKKGWEFFILTEKNRFKEFKIP